MEARLPHERVIERIATHSNTDPMELSPLYEVLDPDALDELIMSMSDGELSFTYEGYPVSIDCDGEIDVAVGSIATD
jgi:hypothetical protein